MILTMKGKDIMNMLARSILALYTLDEHADDTSIENTLLQSISLIAKFPTIAAYSYHAMQHLIYYDTLTVRYPDKMLSTAENFLYMLKGNDYTPLEAELLDLCLVLHAEHGGGNNSTFTTGWSVQVVRTRIQQLLLPLVLSKARCTEELTLQLLIWWQILRIILKTGQRGRTCRVLKEDIEKRGT